VLTIDWQGNEDIYGNSCYRLIVIAFGTWIFGFSNPLWDQFTAARTFLQRLMMTPFKDYRWNIEKANICQVMKMLRFLLIIFSVEVVEVIFVGRLISIITICLSVVGVFLIMSHKKKLYSHLKNRKSRMLFICFAGWNFKSKTG